MNHTRGKLSSIVLAAALGATLTACGGTSTATGDAAEPVDPRAAMAASTSGVRTGDYAFTSATPLGKASGVVHVPSKSATLELVSTEKESEGTFSFRFVDADRYVKFKLDTSEMTGNLDGIDTSDPSMAKMVKDLERMVEMFSGKTWMHVDLTKVKDSDDLTLDPANPDMTGAGPLVGSIVTAQGDARSITGTLDATKMGESTGPWENADFAAMGEAAKAIPYTATLDDRGRLTKLVLDAPKSGDIPAGAWTLDITGYGAQKAQEKPAKDEVEEMPEDAYEMLNS
jgi:hypothetical protein